MAHNPDTGSLRGRHMTRATRNAESIIVGEHVHVSYRDREGVASERSGTVLDVIGTPGTAKWSMVLDTDKGPRTLNLLRVTVLA